MHWLRWDGADLMLTVRVQPRSSRARLTGIREGVLQVALTAPPVEGAANEALTRLLAVGLRVATGRVRIVQGERGRNKVVRVIRPDRTVVEELARRMDGLPPGEGTKA